MEGEAPQISNAQIKALLYEAVQMSATHGGGGAAIGLGLILFGESIAERIADSESHFPVSAEDAALVARLEEEKRKLQEQFDEIRRLEERDREGKH